MSMVISSMPAAGLMETPPVSKITPLPTSASGAASPPPFQRMTTSLDSLAEPWPTASRQRIPSFSSSGSPRISTSRPSSPIAASRAAKSSVVSTLAGSLTRSRVKNTPSATAAIGPESRATASGASETKVSLRGAAASSLLSRRVL